ncbi:conserved hypothetical protein (plasmid) [Sinorhizobium fredii NGR234]|uniref:DUF305 domain-containing protein n=1 Tax=Sinorhizobium fredii (strain NBRC 101917 / NGR234) TaxID=394 RepID=C3KQ21_SINFN|nr:DUF305 domain-containing protein [Sinorhizobium fredii]ACP22179.1 conserved hypothetical protein [Sinorhizobium fredii NGR234]
MNRILRTAVVAAGVAAISLTAATAALAQMTMPEACKAKMSASGMMQMPDADMGQMAEHQKAMMEGMRETEPAMMQGMMAKNPDVAFVCGMIAHHTAAINMSEVELKYGGDQQAKSMAEKIIAAQKKEIEEMTEWVKQHAK